MLKGPPSSPHMAASSLTHNNHNQNIKYAKQQQRKYNEYGLMSRNSESRQLNHEIVHCETVMEILKVLQTSLTQIGGGRKVTHVNLSTSLHQICKHTLKQQQIRAQVLQDGRFGHCPLIRRRAILICGKFLTFPGPWPNCDWHHR